MSQDTQNQKSIVIPVLITVIITTILTATGVYFFTKTYSIVSKDANVTEKADNIIVEKSDNNTLSDLSACGDIPIVTEGGNDTGTFYKVCQGAATGDCYYKKDHLKLIPGCDPEFDKYDFGREDCYVDDTITYANDGTLSLKKHNPKDTCVLTTPQYFNSKVQVKSFKVGDGYFEMVFPATWGRVDYTLATDKLPSGTKIEEVLKFTSHDDPERFITINIVKTENKKHPTVADYPHKLISDYGENSYYYASGGDHAGMPGMEDKKYLDIQKEATEIIDTLIIMDY